MLYFDSSTPLLSEGLGEAFYHTIFQMYRSVCYMCEPLIMCNDDESLTELITEIEEELMQLLFILCVQTT